MSTDPRHQQLIDALQVVAPLAQRLAVTSQQQATDAAALLAATKRAVALVQQTRPGDDPRPIGRRHQGCDEREQEGTTP